MKTKQFSKLKDAIARRLSRPLRLTLGGRPHVFRDLTEFDFCLAARTAVPPLRIGELYLRPLAQLEHEAGTLRTLEMKLGGLLEDAAGGGRGLLAGLRALGVMIISKDNGWREIFDQLLSAAPRDGRWLAAALRHYLEYLAQRRDVIGSIRLLKERAAGAATGRREDPGATAVFERPPLEALADTAPMRRLPQGRAVALRLGHGQEVAIQLARHRFSLTHDDAWCLIADDGRRYVLHQGVNSVGRSRENDIRVDGAFRNVSRRHLIAEPLGDDVIRLTDVSSSGTFLPPTALAS